MWTNEIENLYSEMLEKLEKINGGLDDSLTKLFNSLSHIQETMRTLKEYVLINPFSNDENEVQFFKYTKPRFAAWQFYYVDLHNIISNTPIGTDQMIREYYLNELGLIDRFFKINAFYYQYYLKNEYSKDSIYFLRNNRSQFPPGRETLSTDSKFTTELDYLFSKFRANEMLRDFIIKRIKFLYHELDSSIIAKLAGKTKRYWSGDKIDLVEIAYGIYYTKRLNNGKAEISDIIDWLEESLNIDLSQAYRMFIDIRRRKTKSYTKFLDEMRYIIHSNIKNSFK
ncbi:RteC domain-containing protein [Sphingobacterium siyangense subsp. cladoniae]|uniref:RteC domain-containing protein n=1 Tax=Sphingobacterium siyangense TaxID=459529 RepID=UPI0031F8A180